MRVSLGILGPLQLVIDGIDVTPPAPKERTLLALLAIKHPHVVSVNNLTDELWPDLPADRSRHALHVRVAALRKLFRTADAASILERAASGYRLRVDAEAIDAQRFFILVERARCQFEADGEAAGASLHEALALWRGEPLADVQSSVTLEGEAARLREAQFGAIEDAIETDLACGGHHSVLPDLDALVVAHPLRERLWAQRILALYRCGRQAEALRACATIRRRLVDELGVEPGPELRALEGAVLDQSPELEWSPDPNLPRADSSSGAEEPTTGNISRPLPDFVGRAGEVKKIVSDLYQRPLVTLTGFGGVGKTRLASEIAWTIGGEFRDGVWTVELATMSDPGAVVAAVEAAFGIHPQPGVTPLETIVDWLQQRRLLLIVDNCEHVRTAVVQLVAAVMAQCPTITVLATSREPLGIDDERVHSIPPLEAESEGVELFCLRATAADGSFTIRDVDHAAIAAICQALDGIPLAIELAAARIRSFTPSDLLARLDDRFQLLRADRTGSPERQRTLRATVEWSYELISRREQVLFDRLSVFLGGFNLATAEAVCVDDQVDRYDVASIVGSLVDKSMVIADRDGQETRYRLLETLRRYGEERLAIGSDTSRVHDRLVAYYLQFASHTSEARLGPRQREMDDTFEREWSNLRTCFRWAIAGGDGASADELVALTGMYATSREVREHADWAGDAIDLGTAEGRPSTTSLGWAALWRLIATGDAVRSMEMAHQGIDLASSPHHPDTFLCWVTLSFAYSAYGRRAEEKDAVAQAQIVAAGQPTATRAWAIAIAINSLFHDGVTAAIPTLVSEFASMAQEVNQPSMLAQSAYYKARTKMRNQDPSDPEGAIADYRRALELADSVRDEHWADQILTGMADVVPTLPPHETRGFYRNALGRQHAARSWNNVFMTLRPVALWMAATENSEGATVIYGHFEAHRPPWVHTDGRMATLEQVLRRPGAENHMARGASMTPDQLVAFVLGQLEEATTTSSVEDQEIPSSTPPI